MRKFIMFGIAGTLVLAGGLAWAQKTKLSLRRPNPVIPFESTDPAPMVTGVSGIGATGTIQFAANEPGSVVTSPGTATVTWTISEGASGNTWTLSVYANSASFTGCSTVPASAVGVSCTSATHTGTRPTANCQTGGPFPLLTTAPGQLVASGNEGSASTHTFTVVLTYQLTDSWAFIANPNCPLTVTYTVDAP